MHVPLNVKIYGRHFVIDSIQNCRYQTHPVHTAVPFPTDRHSALLLSTYCSQQKVTNHTPILAGVRLWFVLARPPYCTATIETRRSGMDGRQKDGRTDTKKCAVHRTLGYWESWRHVWRRYFKQNGEFLLRFLSGEKIFRRWGASRCSASMPDAIDGLRPYVSGSLLRSHLQVICCC